MQFRNGLGPNVQVEGPPLLRVTGEGRVEATPDSATISLGVTSRAETAASAFEQTAAALRRVLEALQGLGIPQSQIQSEQVSVNPVFQDGRPIGFEGTATLRVRLANLTAIGTVIDRAVAAGANQVQGLSFELRDPGAAEATATGLAVQDAQRKATLLARSLGVGLGPIWRVELEAGPSFAPLFARVQAEVIPVLPGRIEVTRRVTAEYVIRLA